MATPSPDPKQDEPSPRQRRRGKTSSGREQKPLTLVAAERGAWIQVAGTVFGSFLVGIVLQVLQGQLHISIAAAVAVLLLLSLLVFLLYKRHGAIVAIGAFAIMLIVGFVGFLA